MRSRGDAARFRVGVLAGSSACDFLVLHRARAEDPWTVALSASMLATGSTAMIVGDLLGEVEFGVAPPAGGAVRAVVHEPVWFGQAPKESR
jgi:hypothetical protein